MFDFLRKRKDRVIIFGAGSGGYNFYKHQKKRLNIVAFVDNDPQKQGHSLHGKQIFHPNILGLESFDRIIIASDYYSDIYSQLVSELGVDCNKVSIFHEYTFEKKFIYKVSSLLNLILNEMCCSRLSFLSNFCVYLKYRREISRDEVAILNIRDLHECVMNREYVFKYGGDQVIAHPKNFGDDQKYTVTKGPIIALYSFHNAIFSTTSRSVILEENFIVIERIPTSSFYFSDFSGGSILFHGKFKALVKKIRAPVKLGKGILINGVSDTNYYHWLIEVLTQLYYLKKLPLHYQSIPVFVSCKANDISSVRTLLSSFQISNPVSYLDSVNSYIASELFLITSPSSVVLNKKFTAKVLPQDYYADYESINFLRSAGLSLPNPNSVNMSPDKIFLARRQLLRPYNQDQVWELLQVYGFEKVYLEDMKFEEQVMFIRDAKFIIGPTGAAWTNLVFASPGTKALCWMAEETGDFPCFSHLAHKFNIDLTYLRYATGFNDTKVLYSKRYKVSIMAIKLWLDSNVAIINPK